MWVALYLVLSLALVIGANVLAAVFGVAAMAWLTDTEMTQVVRRLLGALQDGRAPAWFMALATTVQFPTMLAAAWVTRVAVRFMWYRNSEHTDDQPWSEVLAFRRTTPLFLVAALLMGFTTGWLPGWFAGWLHETFPALDSGALGLIEHALTSGWIGFRVVVGLWVAFGAAFFEEVIFRGFLWEGLQRTRMPGWAVWVTSSLIFAGYHMDPVQSSALVFTALVLGWLRWKSGSVWPGVLLHAVNNSLGVAGAWYDVADADMPLSYALGGAMVSVGLCYVVARYGGRQGEPG
jgi:membrane protease YdiL (CAAX protease family)